MHFIDQYSWKSFLSTCTKNIQINNGIYSWQIYKRNQIVSNRDLNIKDLDYLKKIVPFSFMYLSPISVDILKTEFNINKTKAPNISIPIYNLDLKGKKYKRIRSSLIKCSKYDLYFQNDYNNYDEILNFLNEWKETCGDKYFQARIGKNKHLYKEKMHENCINLFCYNKNNKLVSYATISPPINGSSSYIAGKALYFDYPGLSEFTDIEAYKKAKLFGVKYVNLGAGSKNLIKYKMKFPGAQSYMFYNGKATLKD